MKTTLALSAGLLLAQLGLSPGAAAQRSERPNILFLFADDHAYQAIGAYGSRINRTPNIDRLAAAGMVFRRAFVTNSICAPSRAVILTGKHSHLNGQITNAERFDGSQQTFPKLLRGAGYQTALIGKWHLKSDPTGFDHWQVLRGQGPYYNPDFLTPQGKTKVEGYTTDLITDAALEWLRERDPQRPFLLMCQHKAPHRNWMPDPKHLALYEGATIPEPPTLFDDYSGRSSAAHLQAMTVAHHLFDTWDLKLDTSGKRTGGLSALWNGALARLTPAQRAAWVAAYEPRNAAFRAAHLEGEALVHWKYQRYIKDYLRCIAALDDNIGRLLDYLEESGLARNTVVVYSSDQGFYLGEHGWFDKRWMYEESLRTPLIVRWPGVVAPASHSDLMVQNLDFAETFLEIAGVKVPADMQGASLVPILRGEIPRDWRRSIYYQYYEYPGPHSVRRHYGVRTERYKLIYFYNLDEWELYDLERDPNELHSVVADPAYAQVRLELTRELERLRTLYAVPADRRPVRKGK